jgi:hypothetical protein
VLTGTFTGWTRTVLHCAHLRFCPGRARCGTRDSASRPMGSATSCSPQLYTAVLLGTRNASPGCHAGSRSERHKQQVQPDYTQPRPRKHGPTAPIRPERALASRPNDAQCTASDIRAARVNG